MSHYQELFAKGKDANDRYEAGRPSKKEEEKEEDVTKVS